METTWKASMQKSYRISEEQIEWWAIVQLLLEPLDAGKRKIWFSPDGVYTQINLYTLKSRRQFPDQPVWCDIDW